MNVACSAGIPSLKSSLGRTRGGISRVSRWLTSPTASSESGSSRTATAAISHHEPADAPRPARTARATSAASTAAMEPK